MSRRSYTPTLGAMGISSGEVLPTSDTSSQYGRTPSLVASPKGRNHAYSARPNRVSANSSFRIPVVLKRLVKPPTLDFETASWEIFYLLFAPRRVYKQLYYRKQTKNRWSRDDPSFVILLVFFLTVSAVAWGLAYTSGAVAILRMVLYMVVIDFLATGFAIATVGWLLANRLFKKSSPATIGGVSDEELEWAFCFDIHCNSFLIIWVSLYLVQFVLLPVLTLDNWLSLFLGNTMYFGALSYYFVITFYGYNALPFLEHTEMILFPIPVVAALYLCSLFGFSMVKHMSSLYFN